MNLRETIYYCVFMMCLLPACKPSVNQEALMGKWKYVKVENPNTNPPDSVSRMELDEQSPYISFTKSDLTIIWGGKTLSHGSYQIDGSNIRYKEVLVDGKTRDFPFYVSKLDAKQLIFETTGENGSKVTAVKIK